MFKKKDSSLKKSLFKRCIRAFLEFPNKCLLFWKRFFKKCIFLFSPNKIKKTASLPNLNLDLPHQNFNFNNFNKKTFSAPVLMEKNLEGEDPIYDRRTGSKNSFLLKEIANYPKQKPSTKKTKHKPIKDLEEMKRLLRSAFFSNDLISNALNIRKTQMNPEEESQDQLFDEWFFAFSQLFLSKIKSKEVLKRYLEPLLEKEGNTCGSVPKKSEIFFVLEKLEYSFDDISEVMNNSSKIDESVLDQNQTISVQKSAQTNQKSIFPSSESKIKNISFIIDPEALVSQRKKIAKRSRQEASFEADSLNSSKKRFLASKNPIFFSIEAKLKRLKEDLSSGHDSDSSDEWASPKFSKSL